MSTEQAREGSGGETDLFGQSAASAPQPEQSAARPGKVRVVMPNRHQIELRPMDLESLLPVGHRARLVWAWVERQDLSAMYEAIKVREGGVGRSAIAPEILLALWLYAAPHPRARGHHGAVAASRAHRRAGLRGYLAQSL